MRILGFFSEPRLQALYRRKQLPDNDAVAGDETFVGDIVGLLDCALLEPLL